jgi:hypothetical protein
MIKNLVFVFETGRSWQRVEHVKQTLKIQGGSWQPMRSLLGMQSPPTSRSSVSNPRFGVHGRKALTEATSDGLANAWRGCSTGKKTLFGA